LRNRSLNKEKRKRELLRITMENQAILKRLQEKQSNYNVIKWEEQRLQNERLMEMISEYPVKLYDGYREHGRLVTADPSVQNREHLPQLRGEGGSLTRKSIRRRNLNTQQDFYTDKQGLTGPARGTYTSAQKQREVTDQDIGGIINLDADRKVLAKKGRMMSNGYYFIEASKTDSTFYIAAIKKRNSNENYLIELEWSKASEILAQFNILGNDDNEEDFERLMENLEILDNRLVLLNPKVRQPRVIRKKRTKTRGSNSQPRKVSKKGKKLLQPEHPKPDSVEIEQEAVVEVEDGK
jgi:hypothetical protein